MNHTNKVTKFHGHVRALHRTGKTMTESIDIAIAKHPEDYKEFVALQNQGVILQSLKEPNVGRVMSILASGKLP